MKKRTFSVIFVISLILLLNGCVSYPTFSGIFGMEVQDLEKAKENGRTKMVALSYDASFDKVLDILKENKLKTLQVNRKKGYIVAINFPKQTDTTRVGIFFEPKENGSTLITLSSLSTTALDKAENIIFPGLS